jgi:hypothetical protein
MTGCNTVSDDACAALDTASLIVTLAGGLQLGIHPDIGSVGPGERAPFQHLVLEDEITAALNQSQQIQFTGVCEHYGVLPEQEFTWDFQDVEIEFDAARSAVRVSGNVTNISETSAERYAPMLLVFNGDGHYVGSIAYGDAPSTTFSGDRVAFELDHGFDTLHGSQPLAGAGKDPIFVLNMAQPVYAFVGCVE